MSSIYKRQLAAGLVLSMTKQWKRKERNAIEDIRIMLSRCKSPYVSLSWGKQSICLMHMVYRVDRCIPGLFFREAESAIIADFDNVISAFLSRWPITYHEVMYYPWSEDGIRDSHHKAARRWEEEHGMDGVFMGFTRYESRGRRFTLAKADANSIFEYAGGFLRSTPLRLWTDEDIAAYAAKYSIPMLNIYHRFGFHARTSAGLTPGTHSEVGFDLMTPRQRREILEKKKEHGCYQTTEDNI